MKRAGITETKNNLSALLERVKAGESVLIEERGVPIAILEPLAGNPDRAAQGRIERLERQGVLRRARGHLPPGFLDAPLPRPRKGASAVAHLIEERRSGR